MIETGSSAQCQKKGKAMSTVQMIGIKCTRYPEHGNPVAETRGVLAVTAGNWAAHPNATNTGTDSRCWTVSYVPSGLCINEVRCDPSKAIAIAKSVAASTPVLSDPLRPSEYETRAIVSAVNRGLR